jgi:hypothetical protein
MVLPLLQTIAVAIGLFVLLLPVHAYIPAVPTNNTNAAIADGLNVTDVISHGYICNGTSS